MIGTDFYMRCPDGAMWKVLKYEEIGVCLAACHEEGCGNHFGTERTKKKVLLASLIWPSLNRDVAHWCRSCPQCQAYGKRMLMS